MSFFEAQPHPWLLGLAAMVCAAGCYAATHLYATSRRAQGSRAALSMALVGAVFGASVWATHFTAMAAFDPGLPVEYDPIITLLSLMIGFVGSAAGFGFAAKERGIRGWIGGGAIIGLGLTVMHYVGMLAMRTAGHIEWNFDLIALSAIIGGAFPQLALCVAQGGRQVWRTPAAALLLTSGILALHFTAMAAATLWPDPNVAIPRGAFSLLLVTVAVGGVASVLISAAAVMLAIFGRTQSDAVRRLEAIVEAIPQGVAYFDRQGGLLVWNSHFQRVATEAGLVVGPGSDIMALTAALPTPENAGDLPANEVRALKAGAILEKHFRLESGALLTCRTSLTLDGGFALNAAIDPAARAPLVVVDQPQDEMSALLAQIRGQAA